jgi:hypothetical protein
VRGDVYIHEWRPVRQLIGMEVGRSSGWREVVQGDVERRKKREQGSVS